MYPLKLKESWTIGIFVFKGGFYGQDKEQYKN
jgi:hypothetical protein